MKSIIKLLLVCVAALAAAPLAHADSTGPDTISFSGSDTYCTSSSCTNGAVTFYIPAYLPQTGTKGNASVDVATGAFAAFANAKSTTFYNFNYLTSTTPLVLFTSTLKSGGTLTFTVTSMTGVVANGGLTVSGSGYYTYTSAAGATTQYPDGIFNLTTQLGGDGMQHVSFSDTNTVTPEPSSLLLMGTGLSLAAALLFQRRRMGNANVAASGSMMA